MPSNADCENRNRDGSPPDPQKQNWLLQSQLAETRHALDQARQEIRRMRESRSWRATSMLRRISSWWGSLPWLRRADSEQPASHLCSSLEFAPSPAHPEDRLLLVDVTELAIENLQGGIQHTVKGILSELLFAPPRGWRIVPVQLAREGCYVSASQQLEHLFGDFCDPWRGRQIEPESGDVFLGLDLLRDRPTQFREALASLKRHGVSIQIVIYDLLPIDLPDCVPESISARFAQWLDVVGDEADGAACISATVAGRFSRWLSERDAGTRHVQLSHFRLGTPDAAVKNAPRTESDGIAMLMVGTIEPRKGYAEALDAFDKIWRQGDLPQLSLTIVGRYGWGMPDFLARLKAHPELGRRLQWLENATDEEVQNRYRAADALLFCSRGEGFGLPIIEAAQNAVPMILRDLPEFREVAGDGAFYFQNGDNAVYDALLEWVGLRRSPAGVPAPLAGIAITWRESAAELLSAIGIREAGEPALAMSSLPQLP